MGTGETAHIGKKDVVGPAHPDATGQAQENKRKNNDIVMNV